MNVPLKRMRFVRIPNAAKSSIDLFKTSIRHLNPVIYGIDKTKKKKFITVGVAERDAQTAINYAQVCKLQLETP